MGDSCTVDELDLISIPAGTVWKGYLNLVSDGLGNKIALPIIVARGRSPGPIVGLTAAVHGNEINGLKVIHQVFKKLDLNNLYGIVVGLPVVNVPGYLLRQREFNDRFDLNKKMPGAPNGNMSDIYCSRIIEKIIRQVNYLVDLHTASFGRINSYYARADLSNPIIKQLALLQNSQIILNNTGPSGTLRRAAIDLNIPSITIELRDPHVIQKEVVEESVTGIINILKELKMQPGEIVSAVKPAVICSRSYWLYTDEGGLLDVLPNLTEIVKKGDLIARVRSIFGEVIKEYFAPEEGIVIGKSTDPVNQTGSRIIHLGLVEQQVR
ncbi:MAG TPA: succinylglutamate desuccinylase/aspartoacylase family protein [Candidatus Nanoarchaeia archaeon]|nr:succinylglutamate desuccinylase/aspartoacylase family protein [Candidatus Nanoarchaeia archaeon]